MGVREDRFVKRITHPLLQLEPVERLFHAAIRVARLETATQDDKM